MTRYVNITIQIDVISVTDETRKQDQTERILVLATSQSRGELVNDLPMGVCREVNLSQVEQLDRRQKWMFRGDNAGRLAAFQCSLP